MPAASASSPTSRGRASRELLDRALAGLAAVAHRGAWAADGVTGDGAGVLLPLSPALTGHRGAGLAMCFLREPWLRERRRGGLPRGRSRAGRLARRAARGRGARLDGASRACRASRSCCSRRATSPTRSYARIAPVAAPRRSTASTSPRSRSAPSPTRRSARRPSWRRSTPTCATRRSPSRGRSSTSASRRTPSRAGSARNRSACSATTARSTRSRATSPGWRPASWPAASTPGSTPALDRAGSDSALLDNALELLVRAGRDVREAVTMLVPPAWQNDPRVDDDVRAMHRYHSMLVEPWDGPAGLVFTDGVICARRARPQRPAPAAGRRGRRPRHRRLRGGRDSAAGGRRRATARLGPGQQLSVDPDRGLLFDGELKRELASRRPYADVGRGEHRAARRRRARPRRPPARASRRATRSSATRGRSSA